MASRALPVIVRDAIMATGAVARRERVRALEEPAILRFAHMLIASALALAAVAWAHPATANDQEADAEAALEERARVRAHTVRLRIEPDWQAKPGRCVDLGGDDLRVKLRGEVVEGPERVYLDRPTEPTVHALLIDASDSMAGKLRDARKAARRYVETMRAGTDRGLVVGFADSVVMYQRATSDRDALLEAIDRVGMGRATALNDGIYDTLRELGTQRERAVLLLLTDGFDTGSLYDRTDVLEQARRHPDLTVFTIGLGLPPMTATGPPGMGSARTFLQRLASATHGRYFEAPTVSRLASVYRRIREMLDSEAVLTVIDPDADATGAKIDVRSRLEGCRVRRLRDLERDPTEAVSSEHGAGSAGLVAENAFARAWGRAQRRTVDDGCLDVPEVGERRSDAPVGSLRLDGERLSGCVPDLVRDYGVLYDSFQEDWVRPNEWLEFRTRPFELSFPAPEDLPRTPEVWLDRLARSLRSEVRQDPDAPRDEARPYVDLPEVVHGRTFFEMRRQMGRALFGREDYGALAARRVSAEAAEDLDRLRDAFRAELPGSDEEALLAAVYQSREGQRILARSAAPGDADLQRHLAAWHGDVPAHELFVRWEALRLERWLADGAPEETGLFGDWEAARRLFHVPSRARVLSLLGPVLDAESGSVGIWRVVLPRPAWLRERTKGWKRHPEWGRLPLDLIPDVPVGFWLFHEAVARRPGLRKRLTEHGLRVVHVGYELTGKPGRHGPIDGFEETRVTVRLARRDGRVLEIVADVGLRYGRGVEPTPWLAKLEVSGDDAGVGRLLLEAHLAPGVARLR